MYSAPAVLAFSNFKQLLDPADLLNPGVLVRPRPLDADLRRPGAAALPRLGGFAFAKDGGDFTTAVHRCVGVGKCRADSSASGGFMCPSYLATRDEKDSTRGRARVLQEMAAGRLVTGGWRAPEVREALDLCLSCKACATDCPAGVDMAAVQGRGQLPGLPAAAAAPRALRAGPAAALVTVGGASRRGWSTRCWRHRAGGGGGARRGRPGPRRRAIPPFAAVPFRRSAAARRAAGTGGGDVAGQGRAVVLWADSFSDGFEPGVAEAALAVLRRAGYQVIVPEQSACCGLTWISTGQLDGARRRLARLLAILGPVRRGRHRRSSAWSRPAPRCSAPTWPTCSRASRGPPRWPAPPGRWPSCSPPRRRTARARAGRRRT